TKENDILPELKLGYNHLPSPLQRCLAFLSLYKKDAIYNNNEVIGLWMANGLLEHPKQKQEWEDVGEKYLEELLSRCLIQKKTVCPLYFAFKFHVRDRGLYFTFKMHYLVHDLASDVYQKECEIVNSQTKMVDEKVRHSSFCDEKLLEVPWVSKNLKKVRTVIIHDVSKESKTIHKSLINPCVSNFKYLRALKLRYLPLTTLPNSIGALKHLKDLDLSQCRGLQELSRSFYKLRSLQSLNLEDTGLKQLPDSVQRLIEIRHLEITIKAKHLKEIRAGCWTSLQYLKLHSCSELECLPLYLTECNLPQLLLQGSSSTLQQMQITWCRQLSVLSAWLLNLTSLQELRIDGCKNLSALPEGIGRLTNLRQLTIVGCPQLSKRYRQNEGEDWHKIAHIQKVHIHHASADEEASTDAEFTDED
ncbi:hypothetical protein Golax_001499, partial [Gossypium laxum]|nr:hypothetical protein [Gossypium laxum]